MEKEETKKKSEEFPVNLGEAKKVFIEKWLMNFVRDSQKTKKDVSDKSEDGTCESRSISTQLGFWNVIPPSESKQKANKLQFFNAIKKIFKKRKDDLKDTSSSFIEDSETDEDSWCSSEAGNSLKRSKNSSSGQTGSQQGKLGNENNVYNHNHNLLKLDPKNSEDKVCVIYQSNKSQTNKTELNRGYSEVIRVGNTSAEIFPFLGGAAGDKQKSVVKSRNHWPQMDGDYGSTSEVLQMNKAEINLPTLDFKPSFKALMQKQKSDTSSGTAKIKEEVISVSNNSYIKKIELVKRHFQGKIPRDDYCVMESSTSSSSNSKSLSDLASRSSFSSKRLSTDLSNLTKDLTVAPYLKEHERMKWEGKNKEAWFRFNTLLYRNKNSYFVDEPSFKVNSPSTVTIQSLVQRTKTSRVNILKEDSKSCFKSEQESVSKFAATTQSTLVKGTKEREKIEAVFAKEHMKKAYRGNLKKVFHTMGMEPSTRVNTNTQNWHAAVNKVRETMRMIPYIPLNSCIGQEYNMKSCSRCQSKMSVALSLSDIDEPYSSRISAESGKASFNYCRRYKRMPNIVFTPRFGSKEKA